VLEKTGIPKVNTTSQRDMAYQYHITRIAVIGFTGFTAEIKI